jgi:ATP-dependent RNA helicase SUPV3L1/SUV3
LADFDASVPGTITAVLGPTNTGKTHLALERMLGHRTGMIGLPLRLLAREVYDRVVKARGADQVALVTGEEKIVPPGARYWVCTVESMPVDRPVAFAAVDEIQLAGDPHRGHVFTDRLLHLRGLHETWFLGSDTVAPLLQQLVPTAQLRSQPRLSRLSYAGPRKLTVLPPRTAVVAFSVARVYELAERLRARHGGAAVVMGALSPRTRNAQVELFQSGHVQHLVATDAIGMGLNLDVGHVALAGVEKWDGRQARALRPDELAQIAGRAGRWRRDGTFGETGGIEPLTPEVVEAIEHHRFPPLTRLWWRSRDLDWSSGDALLASLQAPPPRRVLLPVRDADDARVLEHLLRSPDVRARLGGADRVRLLWDVCGVPDFGHVPPEHHAGLLGPIFARLVDGGGELPEELVARQVERLDRPEGDLDTLMARLAGIRTWTYVAHRPGWVPDARGWQERARDVEDRLSDALHRQLTARFVDHRATAFVRHLALPQAAPTLLPSGEVRLGDERLGVLRGIVFEAAPGASAQALRAVHRLVEPLVRERLEALLASPDGAFGVDPEGRVRWDGAPVGRLVPGDDWRRPQVRALRSDLLDGAARGRLAGRLDRWLHAWLAARADVGEVAPPVARGIAFAVGAGLGAVPRRTVEELLRRATSADRDALARAGIVVGRRAVLLPRRVADVEARRVLWRVAHGEAPELPDDGGRAPVRAAWPDAVSDALLFASIGPWRVRVDTLERLLAGGDAAAREVGLDAASWADLRRHLGPAPAGPPDRGGGPARRRGGRGRSRRE